MKKILAVIVLAFCCLIATTPLVNANPSLTESDRIDIYRFWSVILSVTGALIVVVVFSYWKEKKRSLNFNIRTFAFGVLVWFAIIFGLIISRLYPNTIGRLDAIGEVAALLGILAVSCVVGYFINRWLTEFFW